MSFDWIPAFVVIIAVLVIFHELGHFAVARLVGMRVEEFAVGFGPKLATLLRRGDTEYTIHLLPLGGFVRIAGMEPGQEDIPDGYQAQSVWKRAIVVFAGPFMSFVLGVFVFVLMGIHWGFPDSSNPENRVGMVNPQTEAARIDLRAGDRILRINGTPIKRGVQMISIIHSQPGKLVTLIVDRDGRTMEIKGTPKWMVQYLGAVWSFMGGNRAMVDERLSPEQPGKRSVEPGDLLISMDGRNIRGGLEMTRWIEAHDGKPVRLELLRNGKTVFVSVVPSLSSVHYLGTKWVFPGGYVEGDGDLDPKSEAKKLGIDLGDVLVSVNGRKIETGEQMIGALQAAEGGQVKLRVQRIVRTEMKTRTVIAPGPTSELRKGYYEAIGLLGFSPAPSLKKISFVDSIKGGILTTIAYAEQMVRTFSSRKRISENVGGPLMIAKTTQGSVALGPYWVFFELGMLSLSLSFINLLPIPILDGGHIAILAVEAVRRKRLTPQQMAVVQMIGLTIIATLVVVIVFSDLAKIAGGKVPQ